MSSEAQVTANRRNARKSTGPKSAEGKAAVARNALRHGLTANQVVLFDEAEADFGRFHDDLRVVLGPGDAVEEALVERIVLCAWRLRRACRAEAGMINDSAETFRRHGDTPELGASFVHASWEVANVARYEAALDRALGRAHAMLERRQARRRGESVPPPIVVDVEGLHAIESKNYETKPISESAPHPNPLPAGGERESPASALPSDLARDRPNAD